ncbi:hypothetical protein BDZ90DRAFT_56688 [Jaminaea rosea]|uniref:Uncharacterized protein n=1 Tax=Jaminaea rosea TaxID=1569628 RepID=A0A316UNU1_9BASI|nr:hypothetical protein BDZ90DRAFT_56688 [Jaminaea rosea]PWN26021.1 hypothetical protein BDZ90DRAFT_56688 [Jaminaea rosea]
MSPSPSSSPPAKPVAIRDRVKAFERLGAGSSPPSSSSTSAGPAFSGGAGIARTSSVPRSRESSTPLYSPSVAQADVDPLAEFGALPTKPAVAAYSSLPLTSSSSSSRNLAASAHTVSSSPTPAFDAFASATSLRKTNSGTSLRDFTEASLPRARNGRTAFGQQSSSQSSVSGKVPLPPPGGDDSTSAGGSGAVSPTTQYKGSPALPPRPAFGQHSSPVPRARSSTTHSNFDPLPPPVHRSSIGSLGSSSSSKNPLDDEEDNYGLSLHPMLHPVSSPTSSRAPSRGSNRSATASPAPRGRLAGDGNASLTPGADIRLQPPTPSPERRAISGAAAGGAAPDLPPRRSSGEQDSQASTSPTSPYSARSSSSGKQPPALPRRMPAAPPVSYKPRIPSAGGAGGATTAVTSAVASKVPPPPTASASVPAPIRGRHSPSASTGSSPTTSASATLGLGHRPTRSTGPTTGLASSFSPSSSPPTSKSAVTHFLPPPTRTRASSTGPSNGLARPRSRTESNPTTPQMGPTTLPPGTPPRTPRGTAASGNAKGLGIGLPPVRTSALTSTGKSNVASKPTRSMAPRNAAYRALYESLWDREMAALCKRRQEKRVSVPSSSQMPPGLVRNIWTRSRLPSTTLANIWAAAMAYDRDSMAVLSPSADDNTPRGQGKAKTRGLSKEAFVRGTSAIDGELAWRASRRATRAQTQAGVRGRRTPTDSTPRASVSMAGGGGRSASSPTSSFKPSAAGVGVVGENGPLPAVRRKLPPPLPPQAH